MRRAVITGIGVISSIGNNKEEVLASLKAGKSGITYSEQFEQYNLRSRVWGNIKLDPSELIDRKVMRFMGDAAAYAYLSMQQAIEDAGLPEEMVSNERTGIVTGSGGASGKNTSESADIARERASSGWVPTWCRVPCPPPPPPVLLPHSRSRVSTTPSAPPVRPLPTASVMPWN